MHVRVQHRGGTAALLHRTAESPRIAVRIAPDPGAVRVGTPWYLPDVPLDAGLFGSDRRHCRYRALARIREDARRLIEYGRTWPLFQVQVFASRRREGVGTESLAGIGEHEMAFPGGRMASIEEMAGRISATARTTLSHHPP